MVRSTGIDLGLRVPRFNENPLLPLSKGDADSRKPLRSLAYVRRRVGSQRKSHCSRPAISRSRSIGYGPINRLFTRAQYQVGGGILRYIVAMIEKHYGRYTKNDSREQLN